MVDDPQASTAAAALGARAFTLGSTIWFGRGEYHPGTSDGRRLIAHEVAHSVQQRHAGASIQRDVVVGDSHDPAEAAADRAADAMMRGERADAVRGGDAKLRRACRAEMPILPVADRRYVNCAPEGARWLVTRRRDPNPEHRRTTAEFDWNLIFNGSDLGLGVRVCGGGTQVYISASANLPEAALQAIRNSLNGVLASRGISIRPSLAVVITQSGAWRLSLEGGPSFSAENGALQDVGATLRLRTPDLGASLRGVYRPETAGAPASGGLELALELERAQIRRFDCSQSPYLYTCRRFVPAEPGRPPTRGIPRTTTTSIYVLFPYNSAQIIGWRRADSPTVYRDSRAISHLLNGLILEGYAIRSIWGYTSPEGERDRDQPTARTGFPGNTRLSQARATAARDALFSPGICAACPTSGNRSVTPVGMSELHGDDPRGRELPRGRRLEQQAIDAYRTDPLRPTDPTAFGRLTHPQQVEQAYSAFRRAEIVLERSPWAVPPDPGAPGRAEGWHEQPCPLAVERAAEIGMEVDRQHLEEQRQ